MYTDASTQHSIDENTQYSIDENTPNNQQDGLDLDNNREQGLQSKSNDPLPADMAKQEQDAEEIEGKLSKAAVDEGLRRTSTVSDFNAEECGEPVAGQHLRISFEFTEEDNVELENKCRSFWNFIRSHPHLERIKVLPMDDVQSTSSDVAVLKKSASDEDNNNAREWVQQDDVIKTAMATKFKPAYCDLDPGDYCEGRKVKRRDGRKRAEGYKGQGQKLLSSSRAPSADELETICKSMEDWDATHPRCMDPPINTTI